MSFMFGNLYFFIYISYITIISLKMFCLANGRKKLFFVGASKHLICKITFERHSKTHVLNELYNIYIIIRVPLNVISELLTFCLYYIVICLLWEPERLIHKVVSVVSLVTFYPIQPGIFLYSLSRLLWNVRSLT